MPLNTLCTMKMQASSAAPKTHCATLCIWCMLSFLKYICESVWHKISIHQVYTLYKVTQLAQKLTSSVTWDSTSDQSQQRGHSQPRATSRVLSRWHDVRAYGPSRIVVRRGLLTSLPAGVRIAAGIDVRLKALRTTFGRAKRQNCTPSSTQLKTRRSDRRFNADRSDVALSEVRS